MNFAAILMVTLILLPAVGMVTWAFFVMTEVEEDLRHRVELPREARQA